MEPESGGGQESREEEPEADPEPEIEQEWEEEEPESKLGWDEPEEEPLPTAGAAYARYKAKRALQEAERMQREAMEALREEKEIQQLAPREQLEQRRLKAEQASEAHQAARLDQAEKMRAHREKRRERTRRMRELEAERAQDQLRRRQAKEELLSFSSIRRPEQDGDLRAATQRWKKAVELREDVDAMFALASPTRGAAPGWRRIWRRRARGRRALEPRRPRSSRVEEVEEKPLPIKRGFIESSGDELVKWRFKAETLLSAWAPAVTSGTVVTAGFAEGLYGISETTGGPLWFVDGGPYTSVVATDDSVVVGSNSGEVRMLDATTGVEAVARGPRGRGRPFYGQRRGFVRGDRREHRLPPPHERRFEMGTAYPTARDGPAGGGRAPRLRRRRRFIRVRAAGPRRPRALAVQNSWPRRGEPRPRVGRGVRGQPGP